MRTLRALCIGGVFWDELLLLAGSPTPDQVTEVIARASGVGGVGRHALVLAGLGYEVTVRSRQGRGQEGMASRIALEIAGVTCDFDESAQDAVSTILLHEGERTILPSPALSGPRRKTIPEGLDLVMCASSHTYLFTDARRHHRGSAMFSYDAGARPLPARVEAARAADLVTGKASFFAGVPCLSSSRPGTYLDGARSLLDSGARLVVVTDGPAPVVALTPEGQFTFTPPFLPALDTAGCGDVFHAVLAGMVAAGFARADSLHAAAEVAAQHAQVLGNSTLTRERLRPLTAEK